MMLWAEISDSDKEKDRSWKEKTPKQRYQAQQAK